LATWQPVGFVEAWQEDVAEDRERVHYLIQKPEGNAWFLRIRVELDE
jgi:hypothetical protein